MKAIPSGARGLYAVQTESADYLLDLDECTATRYPRTTAHDPAFRVAQLRQDGVEAPLLDVVVCRTGAPMTVLLKVADSPGVVTVRQTTPVRRIEHLR